MPIKLSNSMKQRIKNGVIKGLLYIAKKMGMKITKNL